jgi:hypothetical protein
MHGAPAVRILVNFLFQRKCSSLAYRRESGLESWRGVVPTAGIGLDIQNTQMYIFENSRASWHIFHFKGLNSTKDSIVPRYLNSTEAWNAPVPW